MKKYLTIIKTELQRQYAYRYDTFTYVPGNFFELFFTYILWTIIFQNAEVVKGYTYSEMITYIIVGWVFSLITSNYNFESTVSRDINLGWLTNYLSKPISYLKFISMIAIGRIVVALVYIIFQSIVYFILFADKMVIDLTFAKVLILIVMAIFAFFIRLFLSILIGLISFWLVEISGVFAFIDIFVKFFAGNFFPLVFLPVSMLKVGYFLPFIYTFFIPVQFFLNKISVAEALAGIAVQVVWFVILYLIIKIVWHFGLKRYEGYGI